MPTNMTTATPLAKIYKEQGCTNNQTGWNRNTDLCVDIKTFLRKDRVTQIGKKYPGLLMRDGDDHYQFIEIPALFSCKRNPHVFSGEYITITRRDDGTLRPNFKPMRVDENFSIDSYALGVCDELRIALKGLIEK